MKINKYSGVHICRCHGFARKLLALALLLWSSSSFALSCGFPSAPHVLNNPESPENILIGVITETSYEKPVDDKHGPIVGQMQIIETLRGKPRKNIRVTTSSVGHYKGVLHMGLPYLVMLREGQDSELVFGPCSNPLRLDPRDVTFGHGCVLYQFRAMLNIEQPRSRVCEVMNRWMTKRRSGNRQQNKHFRELQQEEILRAKWQDLGVDWSP